MIAQVFDLSNAKTTENPLENNSLPENVTPVQTDNLIEQLSSLFSANQIELEEHYGRVPDGHVECNLVERIIDEKITQKLKFRRTTEENEIYRTTINCKPTEETIPGYAKPNYPRKRDGQYRTYATGLPTKTNKVNCKERKSILVEIKDDHINNIGIDLIRVITLEPTTETIPFYKQLNYSRKKDGKYYLESKTFAFNKKIHGKTVKSNHKFGANIKSIHDKDQSKYYVASRE